ncbi:MAG: complex I NDUFA9 subunit family protein [Chloroflexota bacterium]|nr:complex I NDUFA9 subunit family protein [Chloroflexota bacterium]
MILVTGGTGYVGSRLVRKLVEQGKDVRLLVRDVAAARKEFPKGVAYVHGDVTVPETLPAAVAGVETVIHLVAIIRERGDRTFEKVNYRGTVQIVDAEQAAGVRRHLQMSALGALPDPTFPYHDTKYRAEQYVKASGLDWTIFRPSLIFGPGDQFFSTLAGLAKLPAPFILPDGGVAKFQPVSLDDVVDAFLKALDDPATIGKTFELGGPEIMSYKEMVTVLMDVTGAHRPMLSVPAALLKPAALAFDKLLPKPPVTPEQLKMLRLDNSSKDSATATLIGHPPTSLREGLHYLNT